MNLIKRIKDKHDIWIERQYHKRFPVRPNVSEIPVTRYPVGQLKGILAISPYDMEDIQKEDIYRKLLEVIWPQLKDYIEITCDYDCIAGNTWAVLHAELDVCGPMYRNQDWFSDARKILGAHHENYTVE